MKLLILSLSALFLVVPDVEASSKNNIKFKYNSEVKQLSFDFVDGSDAVKREVDFKGFFKKSQSSKELQMTVEVSGRHGSPDVTSLMFLGSRMNAYATATQHDPCTDECNFLINTQMKINDEAVLGDVILGQGSNKLQSKNNWFLGVQINVDLLQYGWQPSQKDCVTVTTDKGKKFNICAKGSDSFEIKSK